MKVRVAIMVSDDDVWTVELETGKTTVMPPAMVAQLQASLCRDVDPLVPLGPVPLVTMSIVDEEQTNGA